MKPFPQRASRWQPFVLPQTISRWSLQILSLVLCIVLASANIAKAEDEAANEQFLNGLDKINSSSLRDVKAGIAMLSGLSDPDLREQLLPIFEALLKSDLYRHKKDKRLVYIIEKQGGTYLVADLNTPDVTESVKKRAVKRVPLNNHLRGEIKSFLAAEYLNHRDPEKRANSAQELIEELDPISLDLIKKRLEIEENPRVKELLETAIALDRFNNGEKFEQLAATKVLSESLEPTVRNALNRVMQQGPEDLKPAAEKALKSIEDKIEFFGFVETVFFGLSLGSVLVLAAIGLAITFGVMGCINMAHGELIMIGAYTTYVIQLLMPNSIGMSLLVAVPAAFLVSGLVGILIERGVIQFLKGRPLETLLATFGVSLILQQTVRSIFSPLNRSVATPDWMSGSIDINPIFSLTLNRVYIIIFCLMVFAALFIVLRKTVLGLQVRAVSQNRDMARAMGVRSQWVDALTFGLGSGIAGVAGVALSQLTNVGPNLGQSYIIDSFMVVVFGGVGNLWGTLVAGMSLGVANKMLEPVSGAVLAKILVLVFIILFIQKRPRGLFPQKGRAAEG